MATVATYDLTQKIAPFLDKHLIFPLVEFLDEKGVYSEADLLRTKIDLLDTTNMVDFQLDLYKKLHNTEEVPPEFKERRAAVVARLQELKAEVAPFLRVIEDVDYMNRLRNEKKITLEYMESAHQITPKVLESVFKYAKFQFDCGAYALAADYLYYYRLLSSNQDKNFSALWGKFAAEILMQNWDSAVKDLVQLRELIDAKSFTPPLVQLQQRTWLLHWSLFVFFNHEAGLNMLIDLFTQEHYLNAIQTTCPHILRYLASAVIVNKKRRNVLKDIVKVVQQEAYTYRDPVTEFLEALYVNFDFEGAQQKLRQCDELLQADFFLGNVRSEFMENARLYMFETYCRIHQKIDIGMLADKLGMDVGDAERWIVNLIRNARLDAKIDSKENHVIMGGQYPSVYQKVVEKTKGLWARSYQLVTSVAAKSAAESSSSSATGKFQDDAEEATD